MSSTAENESVTDQLREEQSRLQAYLGDHFAQRRGLRVLDAGCGDTLHVDFGAGPWIVGIDIAEEAMRRNSALREHIVGDIQSYPLIPASFDVVICWDVLEHLDEPVRALENMTQALRVSGLLIIAAPNVLSLKGLATKFTPLALHRFAYRRMGTLESQPFPTFMRLSICPQRIIKWAQAPPNELVLEHLGHYEAPMQIALRRRLRLTGRAWALLRNVALASTGGRIDLGRTDFFLVLRRIS